MRAYAMHTNVVNVGKYICIQFRNAKYQATAICRALILLYNSHNIHHNFVIYSFISIATKLPNSSLYFLVGTEFKQ